MKAYQYLYYAYPSLHSMAYIGGNSAEKVSADFKQPSYAGWKGGETEMHYLYGYNGGGDVYYLWTYLL